MQKAIYSPKYYLLLSWLKTGREARGWTIRQLAEVVGESHAVIGKIETGERRLDLFEFVQLCEALNLKPQDGIKIIK